MSSPDIDPPVIDPYPAGNYVPASEVSEHVPESGDGETIIQLRDQDVAVVQAHYWGGYDQPNYELDDLFSREGESMMGEVDMNFAHAHTPEVIAVDRAHGGHFSGAGVGKEYGGHIQMRLDTLQTREVNSYQKETVHTSHENIHWGSGANF